MRRSHLLLSCALSCCNLVALAEDDFDFFETRIRPQLVKHCYPCHSAHAARNQQLEGDFRLDTREGIRRGGHSGPAVVPGKVEDSLLIAALRHESLEMPPTGKLPDAVIADFSKWVAMGAPDPREVAGGGRHEEEKNHPEHWAFRPVEPPDVPEVHGTTWPQDDMDRFVLARLNAAGLRPTSQADPRTLIRRATYDLTGLPPAADQVDAFVRTDDLAAFAKVIDRLLASPHFGVHWARFWLDNVRYTQDDYTCCAFSTNDFDSTPYRDWVVRALNDDLPYNEFVRLQIAGDLIPHEDPVKVNTDGITATGIWTFPHIIADNDPDKVIVDFVDQQIDVLGRTFLGLTISCARCHDHKFDPISQRDYYGLSGIFLSSHSLTHAHPDTGDTSRARAAYRALVPIISTRDELQDYQRRISEIEQIESQLQGLKQRHSALVKLRTVRGRIQEQAKLNVETDADRQQRDSKLARFRKQEAELLTKIDPKFLKEHADGVFARHDRLVEQIKKRREPIRQLRLRPAMLEGGSPGTRYGGKIDDAPLLARGSHTQPRDTVPRAFPAVLCWQDEPPIARRTNESGRRELAEWLVDPRHPLTARVMVNRIWQQLFGFGLVRTPSNFGRLGRQPTHPQLLDHLATRFVESGWSIKSLIRDLMLSSTYRQDSQVSQEHWRQDPDNLLLGRMHRKRLSGEQLFDTLRMLGGTMLHSTAADKQEVSSRALYLKVTRFQQPDDLLLQFDVPNPSLVVPQRSESTAATQALFMLSNPLVLDVAKRWASRLFEENDQREFLERAFLEAYGRLPTDEERQLTTETLINAREQWRRAMLDGQKTAREAAEECEIRAWQDLCHVLLCGNEFLYVD